VKYIIIEALNGFLMAQRDRWHWIRRDVCVCMYC